MKKILNFKSENLKFIEINGNIAKYIYFNTLHSGEIEDWKNGIYFINLEDSGDGIFIRMK